MKVESFVRALNADFFAGVPDSLLKPLCDYLMEKYGTSPEHHIVAANEGNAAAIAAGYHLATGKTAVVYMQNSGEGNAINPMASLLNKRVYAIPVLFVIGWRGEPGVHDEPQHVYQGEVTERLLADMDIDSAVISRDTGEEELSDIMSGLFSSMSRGKSAALIIRKGALSYEGSPAYRNSYEISREELIRNIVMLTKDDPIIATTGKTGRELYEIRESLGQGHERDFLTVGSMGHASSIALGAAIQSPEKKIWCLDGDGAAIMHMGAMAVIAQAKPDNLIHIVLNNQAHESVGGVPTAATSADLCAVARACGYPYAAAADSLEGLNRELTAARERGCLSFIELRCKISSRAELSRPAGTPVENKLAFMENLLNT